MQVKLIGKKKLDFMVDGRNIKGEQLFVSFVEENTIGEMVDRLFVNDDISLPDLNPGDVLEVFYNRKGKPERIEKIPPRKINISQ